jgi:hypothetical protein
MPVRLIVSVVLMLVAGLTVSVSPARAVVAPTCYDRITDQVLTATKWLDAPGTLVGTSSRDVLVGSAGSDTIKGIGGNDVICTEPWTAVPATTASSGLDGCTAAQVRTPSNSWARRVLPTAVAATTSSPASP